MKKNFLIMTIAVAIIVGGACFYGGMKYGQSQALAQGRQAGAAGLGFVGGRTGNQAGNNFTAGNIIAKDSNSITVKMTNGSSKIILYSNSTEISKFVAGTQDDLAVGKTVSITGTANQDGSMTAQSIQIRPAITPTATPTP